MGHDQHRRNGGRVVILAHPVDRYARIAKGWRLREVQPPLIVNTSAQTPEEILAEKIIPEADLEKCRELGAALGAGLKMGVF